jgi:hypothetical protein
MRIYGERHAHRLGPLRLNRSGLRFTSLTLDLGFWRAVLWQAPSGGARPSGVGGVSGPRSSRLVARFPPAGQSLAKACSGPMYSVRDPSRCPTSHI